MNEGEKEPGGRIKLEEGVLQGVIQLHNGSLVSTAVAVVGGREDGDNISVMGPVIPLHHKLMSSKNIDV